MSLDTILNIMSKHHLTESEVMLIYLTFIAQTENGDSKKNRSYFSRWYENGGKERLRDLFNSLKEKGIILKNYNPSTYDPDEIEFSKTFIKSYFKLTGELGQELWSNYPDSLYLNGRYVSLKNITKKFLNVEDAWFWYSSSIGHSIEKHYDILDILNWGKSNDLIHYSILEFIGSRKYEELDRMRREGVRGQASTFDIYSTV